MKATVKSMGVGVEEYIIERVKKLDFELSEEEIRLVFNNNSRNVDFLHLLARYYFKHPGRASARWPERAILCLKRALEVNPKNPLSYLFLAIAYSSVGKTLEAINVLKKEITSLKIGSSLFYEKMFFLVDSMVFYGKRKQAYLVLKKYVWEYQLLLQKMKKEGVLACEFLTYQF